MAAVETRSQLDVQAVDVVARARRRSIAQSVGVVLLLLVGFSIYAIHDAGTQLYAQRVIDGTTNGVLYGAVALALVLVFKATRVINFAQGAMAALGAFLAWEAYTHWGFPGWAAVVFAMAASGIGAAVVERALIRPFDPDNHLAITIVTLGLYIAFNAVAGFVWGFDARGFPDLFPHNVDDYVGIAGARWYDDQIGAAATVAAAVVVIHLLLSRTKLGLAMRTVANSVENARLLGIDVGRAVQVSWALAAASGTLAACLVAPTTYLQPGFMDNVLVFSFAAATLGGLDSIVGAPIAGVVVGVTISLVTGYIPALGSQFSLACAFIVIIAALQFKPAGLFGRRFLERV